MQHNEKEIKTLEGTTANSQRARQFMSFDALKGFSEALRMKEYKHERIVKGDLSEEKIEEISQIFLNLKKTDVITLTYFSDGHYKEETGAAKIDFVFRFITINKIKISFDDVSDVKIMN